MRLEDLFENQSLNEAPATAGVLNTGLDPAQFQKRTGLSPRQATRTIGNITQLNPQFKTPQFRNALTNYLVDNPKTFQAANQNFRTPASIPGSRTPSKVATGVKGLLGRLLGPLTLALTPTTMGNGELDPNLAAAQNEVANFMDYLSKNDPQQYVDIIDKEMSARGDDNSEDLTTHPFYQRAKDALTKAATSGAGPAIAPAPEPTTPPEGPTPANDPKPPRPRIVPTPEPITPETPPETVPTEPEPAPIRRPVTIPPTPSPAPKTDPAPDAPAPDTKPEVIPFPRKPDAPAPDEKPEVDPDAPAPDEKPEPQVTPPSTVPPAIPLPPTRTTPPAPATPTTTPTGDPVKSTPKTTNVPGTTTKQGPSTRTRPRTRTRPGRSGTGSRGRGRGELPGLGGGSELDARQMQFAPINIRDPLNLKRFG